jgi:protein TonB
MGGLAVHLSARAWTLAASAAVHAGVAFVAVGGGHRAAAVTPVAGPASEIAIEPLAPAPAIDAPNEARPASAPAHHTHTHPYPVPADHDLHDHDPSIVHVAHAPAPPASTDPSDPAEAPSVVPSPAPAPRFTMTIAPGSVSYGAVSATGQGASGASVAGDEGDAPIAAARVTVAARLLDAPPGAYPEEARMAQVEADVPVEIVVDTRGAVTAARALKHVGYGLDEAAVATVRRWRYAPAQKDGRLVRVRMTCNVSFRFE